MRWCRPYVLTLVPHHFSCLYGCNLVRTHTLPEHSSIAFSGTLSLSQDLSMFRKAVSRVIRQPLGARSFGIEIKQVARMATCKVSSEVDAETIDSIIIGKVVCDRKYAGANFQYEIKCFSHLKGASQIEAVEGLRWNRKILL